MVRFIKKHLWRIRHLAFQLAAYHSGRYEPSKRAKRCRVRFTGLSGGAQRRARRRASVLARGVCCASSEGKTEYGRGSFSCRHATLHRSVLADVTGPLCVRGENVWVLRGPENLRSWHGLEGTRVLRWNRRAEKRVSRIFLRCPRRLPGANRLRGDVRGLDGGPSQDYDVSAAIAPDCVSERDVLGHLRAGRVSRCSRSAPFSQHRRDDCRGGERSEQWGSETMHGPRHGQVRLPETCGKNLEERSAATRPARWRRSGRALPGASIWMCRDLSCR